MSIRAARADDHWRRTLARQYSVRYERLQFDTLFCLGAGEIRFRGGITAIVGGNGVGKSTLVAAIGELLEKEASGMLLRDRDRLQASRLNGLIFEQNLERHRTAQNDNSGQRMVTGDVVEAESRWLDPAYWAFRTRAQVVGDQNFGDLIEPVSPVQLNGDQIELLSYLVGKDYDECKIFEIPDYGDFERFPYFVVRAHGVEYGSEAMGQGELALLLVFWALRDIRANSILVLEEPETHVSPRSQTLLMNVLAKFCDEKGLWVIVTTHSPVIISRLPIEHIRMLARDGQNVLILENVPRYQLAAVLGGGVSLRGVLLVEDETAKEFVIAVLDELAPDLTRQFEIVVADSEAGISTVLRSFPKTASWLSLVGAFDGDARDHLQGPDGFLWPFVFLPGDRAPEVLLGTLIQGNDGADLLAQELGNRNAIVAALEATAGLDPHDWVIEFARILSVSRADLIRALSRIYIKTDIGGLAAQTFVQHVKASYAA